jgi:hypothetical protein
MALQTGRKESPEYRSLPSPRPERKIVAVWPALRPPGRAANELLKVIGERCGGGRKHGVAPRAGDHHLPLDTSGSNLETTAS